MKNARQEAIISLIQNNPIETQEELLVLLEKEGYCTTQATVSRDIKRLGIKKESRGGSRSVYTAPNMAVFAEKDSYGQVLSSCITSIDYSENIIVIKTVAGMAMAVGAAIDARDIDGIMGSIAGDDTLFLAIKHRNHAESIIKNIRLATSGSR